MLDSSLACSVADPFGRRHDDDDRQAVFDQRDRAVLELAGGETLGVHVGQFLEFQRAFQRHRVADMATQEQHASSTGRTGRPARPPARSPRSPGPPGPASLPARGIRVRPRRGTWCRGPAPAPGRAGSWRLPGPGRFSSRPRRSPGRRGCRAPHRTRAGSGSRWCCRSPAPWPSAPWRAGPLPGCPRFHRTGKWPPPGCCGPAPGPGSGIRWRVPLPPAAASSARSRISPAARSG